MLLGNLLKSFEGKGVPFLLLVRIMSTGMRWQIIYSFLLSESYVNSGDDLFFIWDQFDEQFYLALS